jgi:hypothetical protein
MMIIWVFGWEKELKGLRVDIEYQWVLSHIGIPGNEAADAAPKRAAINPRDHVDDRLQLPSGWLAEWSFSTHLNRQATETQSRIATEWTHQLMKTSQSYPPKKRGSRKDTQVCLKISIT